MTILFSRTWRGFVLTEGTHVVMRFTLRPLFGRRFFYGGRR
jgi:hypothetical protein